MIVALCATAIVVLALLWEVALPVARARALERRARAGGASRRSAATTPAASAAPSSAPASCCAPASTRRSGRCTATSASSACGAARPAARAPARSRDRGGAPYAYLVYPHKPIVAYLPQTGQLLNEYCVEFPDETRPYGCARLPDSDDVLAKWMALKGDERRLIAEANMHLPGRQVDPQQVQRDLWRLGQWERERLGRAAPARTQRRGRAVRRAPLTRRPRPASTSSTAAAPLTEGPQRAAARAYLKGIGFDDEALSKPIIGVASTWIETMPCNFHLRALAAKVKEGIRAAGGTPMEFNTIAISDGITMGTSGMKTRARVAAR